LFKPIKKGKINLLKRKKAVDNLSRANLIHINGIVQGVGFRPFVFKLAAELNIKGWVNNASDGLDIHAEGDKLEAFYQKLIREKPPLALITSIRKTEVPFKNYPDFKIIASTRTAKTDVLISPDVATCRDCLQEMFDRTDRRYRYPFINCTNCGPRYSIILDRPYDRRQTTMAKFAMCPACREEYEDPLNRRFHAQPVACEACGPALELTDARGKIIEGQGIGIDLLKAGAILAVKGLGGFHLVCDATQHEAVQRLRDRKERGDKPFALMARDLATAAKAVKISDLEKEILAGPAAPIVLLPKKTRPDCRLSPAVAPNLSTLGIMLPYTPVHHLLLAGPLDFLVMTSANLSGRPLIYDNGEALANLSGIADYFLLHNRDIYHPCDDSVVRVIGGKLTFVRRARGFVPLPVLVREEFADALAGLGAEMKNAFCLAAGRMAFMSQYIGDMHGYENFERFQQEYISYQKVADVFPQKVAYDLHPDYATTKMAKAMACPTCAVQHHHAHHVSVMTEHGLTEPVLGLACDGTGYGLDGKIWGFEYIWGDAGGFVRKGHLEYLPLPGGDAGAKYPLRIAYAYLKTVLAPAAWAMTTGLWTRLSAQEISILDAQLQSRFRLFDTSSAGRLFDAVSGLLNVCTEVTYEGQAAIELESRAAAWLERLGTAENIPSRVDTFYREGVEKLCRLRDQLKALEGIKACGEKEESGDGERIARVDVHSGITESLGGGSRHLYPVVLAGDSGLVRVKLGRFLAAVVQDLLGGADTGEIAYKFHCSLACAMLETALVIGLANDRLVLSGGVFQNKLLTEYLLNLAKKINIEIFAAAQLPTGDGGLALGQVAVAQRFFAAAGAL
jgi:hydrogenase maturation protein HypF